MALISFDLDGVLQRNPFHTTKPHGVFGHLKRELAPYLGMADAEAAQEEILRRIMSEHHRRMREGRLVEAFDWDDMVRVVGGGPN